ncbi:MAG: tryptophan-rich sensory protein [Planctomycetes bacterium]|nr:tryptophan-rich sensory protein [Planctomycetota bacterium]
MASGTIQHDVDIAPQPPTSWVGVVAITVAVVGVASIGGAVMTTAVTAWYHSIPKPQWTPPDWVFGPVWTLLYTMMGIAASIVWLERNNDDICCPIGAFSIQLALNLAWSVLFFGLRSPLLGFLDICALWVVVGVTMTQFFLVSRTAGWLMLPYWLWITFAGALNASIVLLGG